MPRLSMEHRMAIVALGKEGHSYRAIAARMSTQYGQNVSLATVSYTVQRYNETGTVADRRGRGRKPALSKRESRVVRRLALSNRRSSLRTISGAASESLGRPVAPTTVKRTLKKMGFPRRVAAKKPVLTGAQRRKRLTWARERGAWPRPQWARIVWSDEKIFRVANNKRVEFVTRAAHERYHPSCLSGAPKCGPQVHVWGTIGYRGLGPLKRVNGNLNALGYQNEILHGLENFGQGLAGGNKKGIFMHDMAPPHSARSTRNFLCAQNTTVLDWPGNSPDLNPIENIWAHVQRQLPRTLPRNEQELWARIQTAWQEVPLSVVRNVISSMPARVDEVIRNRGGHTHY